LGDAEIASFVEAKFPEAKQRLVLFAKTHVTANSHQQHPVYAALQRHLPADGPVPHNFFKYLVGRDGIAVRRFHKRQDPLDLEADIRALLRGGGLGGGIRGGLLPEGLAEAEAEE